MKATGRYCTVVALSLLLWAVEAKVEEPALHPLQRHLAEGHVLQEELSLRRMIHELPEHQTCIEGELQIEWTGHLGSMDEDSVAIETTLGRIAGTVSGQMYGDVEFQFSPDDATVTGRPRRVVNDLQYFSHLIHRTFEYEVSTPDGEVSVQGWDELIEEAIMANGGEGPGTPGVMGILPPVVLLQDMVESILTEAYTARVFAEESPNTVRRASYLISSISRVTWDQDWESPTTDGQRGVVCHAMTGTLVSTEVSQTSASHTGIFCHTPRILDGEASRLSLTYEDEFVEVHGRDSGVRTTALARTQFTSRSLSDQ